ncbi:hypothetical protein [Streptomyces sp. NPDC002790]|uniref:hypothetical protein n=1 Tax=Streptomyces sp. NPDC002790 TaxID=3154431 RepID=UPI0033266A87
MTEIQHQNGVIKAEASARPTISHTGERTVTVEATYRADEHFASSEVVHLSRTAALKVVRDIAKALDAHLADAVTQYLAEE